MGFFAILPYNGFLSATYTHYSWLGHLWHAMNTFKMADEIEGLRREIEQKSSELESLKNLLALKVRNINCYVECNSFVV